MFDQQLPIGNDNALKVILSMQIFGSIKQNKWCCKFYCRNCVQNCEKKSQKNGRNLYTGLIKDTSIVHWMNYWDFL